MNQLFSIFSDRFSFQPLRLLILLGLIATVQPILQEAEAVPMQSEPAADIMLPVGQTAFKITVDDSGIYEVSAASLIAKGMNQSLDPTKIQLMQYGEAVAWELINDPTGNPNLFDKNDKIRFYGWEFGADGKETRAESLYVNDNLFWVIPGRSATPVANAVSPAPSAPVVTSVTTEKRFETDDLFSTMSMTADHWEQEGGEPDHYFWLSMRRGNDETTITKTLTVNLPNPAPVSSPATINAVSASRRLSNTPAIAKMTLANGADQDYAFRSGDVFTLTQSMPNSELANGLNTVSFSHSRKNAGDTGGSYYINYLDVSYQQLLKEIDNRLVFSSHTGGNQTFELSGFNAPSAADFIVWNVTDRKNPQKITAVSAAGGSFRFSETVDTAADFAVASKSAVTQIVAGNITPYTPPNLDPAAGYADWLAISHGAFIDIPGTTNDVSGLAAHRASNGNLTTHVVDMNDVANQYGYGFASSHGLHRFITHAYADWSQPVRYVLLGGDGHYNPRHLPCTQCSVGGADFQTTQDSLIPVFHSYSDAFQGLIPADFGYSLLTGDDLVPEVTIGRLSAETTAHMQDAVSKIRLYENNLASTPDWHNDMLFTYDWPKGVQDNVFRIESELAQSKVASHGFNATVAGLDTKPADPNDPAATGLRRAIAEAAENGVSLLTWRGHGSINNWSDGNVMSVDQVIDNQLLPNIDKPFVSITHNCLDGNFAYPGWNGLGETLMRMGEKSNGNVIYRNTGSAAHFAATGLGFVEEHELISDLLFEAIFDKGLTRFGDAINYAKINYLDAVPTDPNLSVSELYSYNLQGDPAMALFAAELGNIATSVSPAELEPDDLAVITFELPNGSGFTAAAGTTLTFTLPKDLKYRGVTADYTGPNGADFNNLSNPADEPYTTSTAVDASGNTVITITLGKQISGEKVVTGGIPADGSVRFLVYADVKSEISRSFWTTPVSLKSPGSTPKSGNVAINLGGARFVYLPFVHK